MTETMELKMENDKFYEDIAKRNVDNFIRMGHVLADNQ